MARMGMDVDAVEQTARDLKRTGESVATLVANIDRTVKSLASVWDGPDARKFVGEWWPQHKAALLAAGENVSGLGQSALNNASEQRDVSGGGTRGNDAPPAVAPPTVQPDAVTPGGGGAFDKGAAQTGFDSRGNGDVTNAAFGRGGDFDGQCTSWVNYRRAELDIGPVPIRWNNGSFYPGAVTADPSVGAVGSIPGHTFIVESVGESSGQRSIVISEMNVGAWVDKPNLITTGLGQVSTATYTEVSPGQWSKNGSRTTQAITFGA